METDAAAEPIAPSDAPPDSAATVEPDEAAHTTSETVVDAPGERDEIVRRVARRWELDPESNDTDFATD